MIETTHPQILAGIDAERRRIERDLHDGAQQRLIALATKLGLVRRIAEADVRQALGLLEEAQADVLATLEEVRALARGIPPPLLADRGVGAALHGAAKHAAIPTTVWSAGIARCAEDVEAAVYFCCLEALQNAAKHAGDTATVEILLAVDDDHLRFEVRDDGVGFDVATGTRGLGLTNIADRLGALGGSVEVSSTPGKGTRITGRVPGGQPCG